MSRTSICRTRSVRNSFRRRGIALVVVMVMIIMVSLGVYSYAQLMTAQQAGTIMAGRRVQARAAVASGVEYLKGYLTLTPEERLTIAGGHWDNPSYFRDIPVMDDGVENLRFSIVSVDQDQYGEPTTVRFGLTDEGSKLNVNQLVSEIYGPTQPAESEGAAEQGASVGPTDEAGGADSETGEADETVSLSRDALMVLPGMTEMIADAILDWIDEDDEPRDYGAEASAYMALGYEPRNGPISSLDELLLVHGVTSELLYGADRNHNGMLDTNEQSVVGAEGDAHASMARGWSAYLTVRSQDMVEQAETTVDLNQDDLETLYDELVEAGFDQDFAAYVVVYRQSGPYQPEIPADAPDDFELPEPQSISSREIDFSKQGQTEINSILDLLGSSSQGSFIVQGQQQPETVLVQSPYMDGADLGTVLPDMMSLLAASGELGGSSGVNTNLCGAAVLSGLPNLEVDVVQNILQMQDRSGGTADLNYSYPTWPLGVGAVTIEQMKALMPFVAGTGTVYRAQIIGYSDTPGVFARAEVVIDASGDVPQVLSWRDLSHLGLGFSLDTLTQ